jgi:hypothetical protein
MGVTNLNLITEIKLEPERTHFHYMLAKNPNYFGNIPGSKLKPALKLISNTSYEQITCIGYNPDTANMEATFAIKKTAGYSGNLCAAGSLEHVRFYLDFHDGAGFIDQGSVAINVHDIPAKADCNKNSIFPIIYVATLKKKTPKIFRCTTPVLPTLRAILSWNTLPPANSPNWLPVWGNVMDCDVQLKPMLLIPPIIDLSDFLAVAIESPQLTAKQIGEISGVDLKQINPQPEPPGLSDLVMKSAKLNVPASRFALKAVQNMIKYPTSDITMMDKATLSEAKINADLLIDQLAVVVPINTSKANVDFEELDCVGLDYNTESLVATIRIKKKNGYSGDLCDAGSKEYVSFWIDWDDNCTWTYLNTAQLVVHDLNMVGNSLLYSVSLPLDATFHRMLCEKPNIVRVRGVLSWNIAPSTTDPNKLEYYGNRVDAHIQIKPGETLDPNKPKALFTIIGGIDVDHVDDATGLTLPGSKFSYNALAVPTGAPFGGEIVINGPSFIGHKYRFLITNLNTGVSYYLSNPLTTVGWSPTPPYSPWFTHYPDGANFYDFLPSNENLLNVLAMFTPGTEDKFKVEMEVLGVGLHFSKVIQMDNTKPVLQLAIDDGGDCTHYSKGDVITGHYYVYDKYIYYWNFGTTWGGAASGTANTIGMPGTGFSVLTPPDAYPCGGVSLYAIDKTIINSQSVGHESWAYYNICLKNKV